MIKWSDTYFCEDEVTKEFIRKQNVISKSSFNLEQHISENNLKLSSDYIKLVLERNGGSVEDNTLRKIVTKIKGKKIVFPKDRFVIQLFFGVTDLNDFSIMYFFGHEYLVKKMLPFALDCGGDKFLLDISNSLSNGQVYIEIHDVFDENDERCKIKIADNFSEFLDLIVWDTN